MEGHDPKKCTIGLAPHSRTPSNCKACGYRCTEAGVIEFLSVKHKTDPKRRVMPPVYKNDPHSPRTVIPIKRDKEDLAALPAKRNGNYGHKHSAETKAKIGASLSKSKTNEPRQLTPDMTPLSAEERKILERLELVRESRFIAEALTKN